MGPDQPRSGGPGAGGWRRVAPGRRAGAGRRRPAGAAPVSAKGGGPAGPSAGRGGAARGGGGPEGGGCAGGGEGVPGGWGRGASRQVCARGEGDRCVGMGGWGLVGMIKCARACALGQVCPSVGLAGVDGVGCVYL